ncbi:MAG: O-acetyl-ADP-ribose deacetylase [Patescibacteria group bacterium]
MIEIKKGDITKEKVDAIVNAANSTLTAGGGVDDAIHEAAGPELQKVCSTLGGCETGKTKITKGFNLPAKYVIHTVGPIWMEGKFDENEYLRDCYANALMLADEKGLKSIAFPAISTGAYGYPQEAAAKIAINTVQEYLKKSKTNIEKVIFVLFKDEDYNIYSKILG